MSAIVISGAARGLGRAMVTEFASRGHSVFAGVRDSTKIPEAKKTMQLNVRNETEVTETINRLANESPIDILINNAGYYVGGALEDVSQDKFKHVLDVNVLGVWRLTRAALPHMRSGGIICMISSLSGIIGMPEDGPYAASKFALEGMSQSLAAEVSARGIRVIVIEPSAIATGFANSNDGEDPRKIAGAIANIIETPDQALRYPLGETASIVANMLDLDIIERGESVVQKFAGASWKPKILQEKCNG